LHYKTHTNKQIAVKTHQINLCQMTIYLQANWIFTIG
jgi:hypothetical protein